MKLKFKLIILLLGLGILTAQAEEYTKKEHTSYLKAQIQAVDVTNKFGTITINDFGGDSVVVDVLITVENANEKKANYLLDQIEIDMRRVGNVLNLTTRIKDDFKTKGNFSIDYTINIPADRDLDVTNKFGNLILNNLSAQGAFNISYGNMTAGYLEAPENSKINLELSYGKADIESVNHLQTEIRYSKLFIGEAKTIGAESRYSGLNVEELGTLVLDSKYDGVNIEKLGSLQANSKYTNYDIEELKQSLVLDTQYGSVRVNEVSDTFEKIDITNSYGGIEIGLDDQDYFIDATCDYCDVNYPESEFVGNREKRDHSFYLQGNIGAETSKKVLIRSRYGGIKLD
ncbi:hypothetical protein [Sunxiuqinia sp. sy24]|uniref:hypothetical protein n=1 Tax=Sunxiuqinia sp. sy24 TaxID=3461495 RepID=UPI0040468681